MRTSRAPATTSMWTRPMVFFMPVLLAFNSRGWMQKSATGRDAPRGKARGDQRAVDQRARNDGRICPVARETKRGLRKTLGQSKEKFSEILERGAQLLLRRRRFTGHRK